MPNDLYVRFSGLPDEDFDFWYHQFRLAVWPEVRRLCSARPETNAAWAGSPRVDHLACRIEKHESFYGKLLVQHLDGPAREFYERLVQYKHIPHDKIATKLQWRFTELAVRMKRNLALARLASLKQMNGESISEYVQRARVSFIDTEDPTYWDPEAATFLARGLRQSNVTAKVFQVKNDDMRGLLTMGFEEAAVHVMLLSERDEYISAVEASQSGKFFSGSKGLKAIVDSLHGWFAFKLR